VTLVQATLAQRHVAALPQRLIGDKAYDSDKLDRELARQGIEMIAPHRCNRRRDRVTAERCAATAAAGKSNASSPGWAITAAWSCATSVIPRIFMRWSSWPVA
jgi:hypothetical protein